MKTKLLTVAALLCCILCAQSFTTVSNLEVNKPKEEIELEKIRGTRSATSETVEAVEEEKTLQEQDQRLMRFLFITCILIGDGEVLTMDGLLMEKPDGHMIILQVEMTTALNGQIPCTAIDIPNY